jgi:hypothetical protein
VFLGYSPFFNLPVITDVGPAAKLPLGDLNRREFFLILPLLIATVAFGL